ncbi:hypothetical protein [uncultured Brachyspira sp.]|uniref:hypothetical protein n=1 Tax=uncultured Brachyspira sp. TaxID=221953 RepID=UPI00260A1341|nr:hypothetical protein [uncultured Brachyspira sp.]
MENIDKNNINTNAYKNIIRNFNIVIGISFILLISSIYVISIFSINIPKINSDTNLELLETVLSENFIFYIKIFFSFLIPLTFFIFTFLFVLNPINVKSILISFILIFLTAIYLYNLKYEVLLNPLENTKSIINLIVHITAANFIILFISALSYIKYDIKKLNNLYDFYTMIAEILIWSFLIFFIMFLIIGTVFALLYFNGKIDIKILIKYLLKNNLINLKILLSIFTLITTSVIYFSFILYNKMPNTKLSINISRTLSLFVSAALISLIITFKYNLFNHYNILLYACIIFQALFIINMFLFRIDKECRLITRIIYIISNAVGIIFSIFCFKNYTSVFSDTLISVFYIIITFNYIHNIIAAIIKKYRNFIFTYNYIYIIFFIIILFN